MRKCALCADRRAVIIGVVAAVVLSCRGSEWRVLTTDGHPHAVAILSLVFTDALHGWAATATQLLESKDGGKNWGVRLSAPGGSLQALYFQNRKEGWIVGSRDHANSSKGAIWRTADGGGTWSVSLTDVQGPLLAVSFCTANLGFAVGPEHILRTTDGGVTWLVSFAGSLMQDFWGVACSGPSEAVVIDNHAAVLQTVDGGESWHQVEVREPVTNFTKVYFAERTGWILGSEGMVLRSDDGGESWKRVPVPITDILMDIRMNGIEGWIVGMRGTILRSMDGGTTWKKRESPTDKDLVSLSFLAPDDGWAGGSQMTVLRFSR